MYATNPSAELPSHAASSVVTLPATAPLYVDTFVAAVDSLVAALVIAAASASFTFAAAVATTCPPA
jgi:hypothetical protein